MCKDIETRGRGEVRLNDSEREQSRVEGPGDKLRAKRRQRQHEEEGQRRTKGKMERGKRGMERMLCFLDRGY